MNPYIEAQLILDEGLRLKPYKCTAGRTTIGVGRNLDDLGITKAEALYLLANDIARVEAECLKTYPWYSKLDPVRQSVILNMRFNLGPRLDKFVNTLTAIAVGDYADAAQKMGQSLWARQVGQRAVRLAQMMRTGVA